mgnify:CR=1 FL=1
MKHFKILICAALAVCLCFGAVACSEGFDPQSASIEQLNEEFDNFFKSDLGTVYNDEDNGKISSSFSDKEETWSYQGSDVVTDIVISEQDGVFFATDVDGERVEEKVNAYILTSAHPAMLAPIVCHGMHWFIDSGCASFDSVGENEWKLRLDGVEHADLEKHIPWLMSEIVRESVELDNFPDDVNLIATTLITPIFEELTITVENDKIAALRLTYLDCSIEYRL